MYYSYGVGRFPRVHCPGHCVYGEVCRDMWQCKFHSVDTERSVHIVGAEGGGVEQLRDLTVTCCEDRNFRAFSVKS